MLDLFKNVKKFLLIPLLCLIVMTAGACGAAGGKDAQKSDSSRTGLTLMDQEDGREADSAGSVETQENDSAGSDEEGAQEDKGSGGKDSQEDTEKLPDEKGTNTTKETTEKLPDENGTYTKKEDVALFLHVYGRLPDNFMTKKQARALGWSGGSLERYAQGMCIGGDRFGNYEGTLPEGNYHECDINTLGKSKRGAKRLVYSDDGRIYYTDDHYETFTLLYGEE